MPTKEKKFKKDEGTVIAYHRYVQDIISDRLNSQSLGPGYIPCKIAKILFPIGLVFLAIGLFVICLRPHHLYLVGVWPRFLGPFFVILFMLAFGASIFFWDLAMRRSNKFRRHLKFRPYGLYGTKVIHDSEVEREQLLQEGLKSGTNPHKPSRSQPRPHRYGYPHRTGANNEGYDRSGDRHADRSGRGIGPSEKRVHREHPYSDPPPQYQERENGERDRGRYPESRGQQRPPPRGGDPRSTGWREGEERSVRDPDGRYRREGEDRHRRDRERQVRYDERGPQFDEARRPRTGDIPDGQKDEYSMVERPRKPQDLRRDARYSASRYEAAPQRFYDEVPVEVQPAEEHHVVTRRTAQPAQRYSERYIDENLPLDPARPRQGIEFQINTEDSAV